MSVKDIPFKQFKQVFAGFSDASTAQHDYVRVAVVLDGAVPKNLTRALKEALIPENNTGLVNVSALSEGDTLRINPDCDIALIVAGSGGQAIGCARAYFDVSVPVAILVESSVDVEADNLPANTSLICAISPQLMLKKLAAWMVSTCDKRTELATNFSFVRGTVIQKSISEHAAQNAIIGALPFGNGADMPVMAANQFLMSLDISSAHGRNDVTEHLISGAGIIASSFVSRATARKLSSYLPGLGTVVRAGVGFGATYAIGKTLEVAHAVQDAWKTRQ